MSYYITQSEAASRLGISQQALKHLMDNSPNCLLKKVNGSIDVPSLLAEIRRRYEIVQNALEAAQDECKCCKQKLSNPQNTFIQGHDSVLRSALQTLYSVGNPIDRSIALAVIEDMGKTETQFLKETKTAHLFKDPQ